MRQSSFFVLLLNLLLTLAAVAQPRPHVDLKAVEQNFDPYVETQRKAWGVPGMAVALIADGKVVWSKAYGVREEGKPEPVTLDTVFQIGSLSKSFTSALAAIEVDRGKLAWDDRVIDFYPEFRTFDPWVTREFRLDDTMSQRSGQASYASDGLVFLGADREEILSKMRLVKPVTSFRSKFAYVNNMWLATARVLEKASGKSWEQMVQTEIFTPLGMTHSTTDMKGLFGAPNHASPHQWNGKSAVALPPEWPYQYWVYTYAPAGGINSTLGDMSRYVLMQLGNTNLIKKESLEVLHAPHTNIGGSRSSAPTGFFEVAPGQYCLGWLRQEMVPYPLIWHNGGTTGFRSVAGFVPGTNLGIVVLSNTADSNLGEALMYRYYDMAFGLPEYDYGGAFLKSFRAEWPEALPRPTSPRPPADLDRYTGSFRNELYGTATVRKVGEHLELAIGKSTVMTLSPWDGDTFIHRNMVNPAVPGDFATFVLEPKGTFDTLRLSDFSDAGDFTRSGP